MSERAVERRDERAGDATRPDLGDGERWTARLPDEDSEIGWDEHEGMLEWGLVRRSD